MAARLVRNIIGLRRLGLAALLACCMLSEGAAQTPAPSPQIAKLKVALQQDLNVYLRDRATPEHLSALSLTVSMRRDQPLINLVSGTTTFGGSQPARVTDLYQIGSNTKAFTAVAVLQLEAQGRLSIDAPIGRYLPQYPAFGKLTLRQLLSMTSGLESYDNTPSWERMFVQDPTANVSADRLIRLVYPKQKFHPGTKYYYSNTGYLLAQKIVDARSESKSFDKEIARIIASVGLKNTFYASNVYPPVIAHRVIDGYYENDDAGFGGFIGENMSGYSLSWAQGAGSIISTPQDLTRWVRALYQGTMLLPQKQKNEMTSLVSTKTAKPLAYPTAKDPAGFGLGIAERYDPQLGTLWFYQGETLGFRAAHLFFPKSDLVVTLFANSRPTEAKSKLQELFKALDADIQTAAAPSAAVRVQRGQTIADRR